MKKLLLLSLLTLALVGCTDENNNDIQAKKMLLNANSLLQSEESYVETHLRTERLDSTYIQTEVTVREPKVTDKDSGTYVPNYTNKILFGFPYAIKTKGDLENSQPTRIVDETGKTTQEYFMTDPKVGPAMIKEDKNVREEVSLKKEDIQYLLDTASKQKTLGDIGVYAYTDSDFYLKSLPNRVSNLVEKETRTVKGTEVVVLEGDLKAHKEESFLIFEKATVQFWIEKESGRIIREVYRSKEHYEKDTGAGEEVFAYTYGEKLNFKDKAKVLDKVKSAGSLFNDSDKQSAFNKTTKSHYDEVYAKQKAAAEKKEQGSDE